MEIFSQPQTHEPIANQSAVPIVEASANTSTVLDSAPVLEAVSEPVQIADTVASIIAEPSFASLGLGGEFLVSRFFF